MAERELKCHGCGGLFPRSSLIIFNGSKYCQGCYTLAVEKAQFSEAVCRIFGLKRPGALIWTQRKQLREKHGYTDKMIICALEYIRKIKKGPLQETLGLVPYYMAAALQEAHMADETANKVTEAIQEQKIVRIDVLADNSKREKAKPKRITWNPDDFIDIE